MVAPIAVIGGGLAGISAALELARAGRRVTLFERGDRLGGRVRSHRQGTQEFDNAQHVLLGNCDALLALLDTLGLSGEDTALQTRARVPVIDGRGRIGWLGERGIGRGRAAGLWGLARYALLSPRERASVVASLLRLDSEVRRAAGDSPWVTAPSRRSLGNGWAAGHLDQGTFADWLSRHAQGPRARRYFWDLLVTPTLNAPAEAVSTAAAAFVLRSALMTEARALRVGWPRRPLTPWLDPAARRALERHGVALRLSSPVDRIQLSESGQVEAVEVGHRREAVTAAVLALPHGRVARLLPKALAASPPFDVFPTLGTAAIVGVHLCYDRPVGAPAILAAPDSEAEWIFNTGRNHGARGESSLSVALSYAQHWLELRNEEILARIGRAIGQVLPRALAARQIGGAVFREPRATFVPGVGVAGLRPGPSTPVPGLVLAGAWTNTGGWPSTMEGAVRSGAQAATALLAPPRS